jgi:hypothetical protein
MMDMIYLYDNKVSENSHVLAVDNICGSLKGGVCKQISRVCIYGHCIRCGFFIVLEY